MPEEGTASELQPVNNSSFQLWYMFSNNIIVAQDFEGEEQQTIECPGQWRAGEAYNQLEAKATDTNCQTKTMRRLMGCWAIITPYINCNASSISGSWTRLSMSMDGRAQRMQRGLGLGHRGNVQGRHLRWQIASSLCEDLLPLTTNHPDSQSRQLVADMLWHTKRVGHSLSQCNCYGYSQNFDGTYVHIVSVWLRERRTLLCREGLQNILMIWG